MRFCYEILELDVRGEKCLGCPARQGGDNDCKQRWLVASHYCSPDGFRHCLTCAVYIENNGKGGV
jgi:hypothetical protein